MPAAQGKGSANMSYAIVYSSRTGNTAHLAEAIREALPKEECVYFGKADDAALKADRLYIGFWTDKGTCDADTEAFLESVQGKEVFLFGTAGFGRDAAYFDQVLGRVKMNLKADNRIVGTYMCQGRMPRSVRERYEKMRESTVHIPNLEELIENFDQALAHPNDGDLARLKQAVL